MVQTANQTETVHTLKQKIVSIYEYLLEHQDLEQAEKVKQLAKKLENREFLIAFCGHFSAGKSTMINHFVGENLLPSSPIPTSANLVKVKSGEDYAKVFFKREKPRVYLAPYDYELVKNYCKDGDKIEELEISFSNTRLPANTVIMDTPGIDSVDGAHQIATESVLHLADMIFYVMDYNHVQAELNFIFTKELTTVGKEVYLVINQIDKHKDEELSFPSFQKSVVDSFAAWGVKPKRIFYTSLKHNAHPLNEFNHLQEFIAEKLKTKEQLLVPSILYSLRKITQDHLNHCIKSEKEELLPKLEILKELSDQEQQALETSYQKISFNLNNIKQSTEEKEKGFVNEISQIMKNAYLMPFQTRELAESFLLSCQSEFKVGFLFSKKKTQEEKEKRLVSFYQDLVEKTKSQLEWHLREFLLRSLKETELDQGELQSLGQSFSIQVPIDLVKKLVKPSARVTGDYVLHYTEDVASEIKRSAKKQITEFKERYLTALIDTTAKQQEHYEKEINKINKYVMAKEEVKKHKKMVFLRNKTIDNLFAQSEVIDKDVYQLFVHEEEEFEVIKSTANTQILNKEQIRMIPSVQSTGTTIMLNYNKNESQHDRDHLQSTFEKLNLASELLIDLPGFQTLAKELKEKAERFENKGFTVALFGAFSAGKSSFANALMGEKILPVSPNPTTAAINKIKPVTQEHPHGTALVKFKEASVMLADVNRSLKVFDFYANDFETAMDKIEQIMLKKRQENILEKTHFSFLQAFKKDYSFFSSLLGTVKVTNIDEFHDFVAMEEKSCYVEWIELYYDCELTRNGITIVDTPGADSINARHTDVAFNYIKNSDAILFVTYYNHAFSKADREFLIQLGRVKESFQMDKMFFIINAIDLAENDEEQEIVVDYVEDQLIKYGIRNPHLYPLSSLTALKEKSNKKRNETSGISKFEQAFYYFISNGLTKLAVDSAKKEMDRVQKLVSKLIQSSRVDNIVKGEKRVEIERQKRIIRAMIEKQNLEPLMHRLSQEVDELIYYIKQRVFLRFGDFFKEAFNPSTLREDGRNLKKALQIALDEFLESLGYDFAQELRATTLRLDRFIERLLKDHQSGIKRDLLKINQDLSFTEFEKGKSEEIDFPTAFCDLEQQIFTKAMTYFKNPKSFFEKNEKVLMSEELYRVLNSFSDIYLQKETSRLNDHYAQGLMNEFNSLVTQMDEQVNNFYLALLSALDGGVSIERLIAIQQKLTKDSFLEGGSST